MKSLYVLIFILIVAGCAGTEYKENQTINEVKVKEPEKAPENVNIKKQETIKQPEEIPKEEKKLTPSGSSMAAAVQTIKYNTEEIKAMLKLIEQVRKGDVTLDCQADPKSSFSTLQAFFGRYIFGYDDYSFWFNTKEKGKVGLNEKDGIIKKCTYGLFPPDYKRAVTIQQNRNIVIITEFFVDSKTGELMIHRNRGKGVEGENYNLEYVK